MFKLAKYLKPNLLEIALIIVLVISRATADLQLPDYMARIINEGVLPQDSGAIFHIGLIMLVISLFSALCAVGVGFFASRVATSFTMDIRHKIFAKVESFSLAEFNTFSTASLITRTTNDLQQIQIVLVMMLRLVLFAPIMGIGAVIKAYDLAPSMTWIMAISVCIMVGIIIILFQLAMPRFTKIQKLVDKLNLVTRQALTGLRVIRAFDTEKVEEKKFDEVNVDLTKLNLFVNRLTSLMQPIMMLIFNITAIWVIWVGAHLVGSGDLPIGNMLAFLQYTMQVIMSFLMISMIFMMIPRASVSASRVAEVLSAKVKIKDPENPKNFPNDIKGQIEFNDVSFIYPGADAPILEHISFKAKQGEVTAIVGSTGSGKSTLVNLIPRFYDISDGQILVDSVDIRTVKQTDLFEKIGFVSQKAVLFSGTIRSNIIYGKPDASDEEIHLAAKVAQAAEFINKLPEKYESRTAQGGTNFSGGQKQRISIARALVRKPEIYIFDDSFSALDLKTDVKLREALSSETKNSTVIIVGQRISTIMDANQIIVLDQGKIVGIGDHHTLMKECKVYQEIAYSQLSKAELQQMDKELLHKKEGH
jgi:ATP-binding cassette subfamily B multidrug efflux pump